MPSVHLLRHGAHADVGLRLTGRGPENGLTELGRAQAQAAADALSSAAPSAIYASPRRRTRETAAVVARLFGLEVIEADALDEVDFGAWEGRTFAELDGDPQWNQWNVSRSTTRCPGGETQKEAQVRALAFAFEIAARHPNPALLVTHCDIIRALICWSERRSLDDIHAVRCDPGSLVTLSLAAEAQAA